MFFEKNYSIILLIPPHPFCFYIKKIACGDIDVIYDQYFLAVQGCL